MDLTNTQKINCIRRLLLHCAYTILIDETRAEDCSVEKPSACEVYDWNRRSAQLVCLFESIKRLTWMPDMPLRIVLRWRLVVSLMMFFWGASLSTMDNAACHRRGRTVQCSSCGVHGLRVWVPHTCILGTGFAHAQNILRNHDSPFHRPSFFPNT